MVRREVYTHQGAFQGWLKERFIPTRVPLRVIKDGVIPTRVPLRVNNREYTHQGASQGV